eukprot:scaffold350241_cov26-Prasinocladus_malaysianus.AAC.1
MSDDDSYLRYSQALRNIKRAQDEGLLSPDTARRHQDLAAQQFLCGSVVEPQLTTAVTPPLEPEVRPGSTARSGQDL